MATPSGSRNVWSQRSSQRSIKRPPPTEDEVLFDLFGQYVFGDLEIPTMSPQLDELNLPKTRRKNWSDFVVTIGEDYEDALKSNGPAPKLDTIPVVEDEQVAVWWNELAANFSQNTWASLLDGSHSSQQSNQPHQQVPSQKSSQTKHGPAPSSSRLSLPNPPSNSQRPPDRPKPKAILPGSKSATHEDIDEFFKRSYAVSKRKRSAPSRLSDYDVSDKDDEAQGPASKTAAQKKPTGKSQTKGKGKAATRTTNAAPPKSKKRGPSAQEEKEFRAAREGRAAESNLDDSDESLFSPRKDEQSVSDGGDDSENSIEAVLQPSSPPTTAKNKGKAKATRKSKGATEVISDDEFDDVDEEETAAARPTKSKGKVTRKSKTAPEVINVDDIEDADDEEEASKLPARGLGSRGSKFINYYIRTHEMEKEWKVDKKTQVRYEADVEWFLCRCCQNKVKVTNDAGSSLALHFNPRSTSYCKYKFTPKDKSMKGVFDDAPDAPWNKPSAKGAAAAVASSTGAPSNVGSFVPATNNVEHWLADGKQRAHKMLSAVVRRRSIAWIILECLPFTIVASRSFLDMVEAITPAALKSFKSARQVKRDIKIIGIDLFDQAVAALSKTTFSMQLDEWTTPGMQHAFQALVVTHIDANWEYHSFCVDFQVIRGRHSGSTFAGNVVSWLTDNDLTNNWNGVLTTDSASSNSRMSTLIQDRLDHEGVELKYPFDADTNHIRCFAHHLNLVVQALYVALGVPKEENIGLNKIVEPVGGVVAEDELEEEHCKLPGVGEWSDNEKEVEAVDDEAEAMEEEEEVAAPVFDPTLDDDDDEEAEALRDDMDTSLLPPRLPPIPEEDEVDSLGEPSALTAAVAALESQSTVGVSASGAAESQSTVGAGALDGESQGAAGAGAPDAAPPRRGEDPTSAAPPPSGTPKYISPLVKVATIVKIARSSPERRRRYLRKAMEAYAGNPKKAAAVRIPPAYNKTRWNSRYFQLHAALKFAKGMLYVVRSDDNGDYDISLNLVPDEIKLLRQITDVLTYFLTLTKAAEKEAPTAADILRYHGTLAHVLKMEIKEAKVTGGETGKLFANALQAAADKLSVYRARAAKCDALLLATILHPKYRLHTFGKDYTSREVDRAKELLRREVERVNGSKSAPLLATLVSPAGVAKAHWQRSPEPEGEGHTDEITAYLVGGFPFRSGETALGWWRDNTKNLPVLAEVAKRVLASAGSTAAVERVFSAAGRVCSPRRRSVSPGTIQELVISQQLIKAGFNPMTGTPLPDDVEDGSSQLK